MVEAAQLRLLQQFVELCQRDPNVAKGSKLKFFREFMYDWVRANPAAEEKAAFAPPPPPAPESTPEPPPAPEPVFAAPPPPTAAPEPAPSAGPRVLFGINLDDIDMAKVPTEEDEMSAAAEKAAAVEALSGGSVPLSLSRSHLCPSSPSLLRRSTVRRTDDAVTLCAAGRSKAVCRTTLRRCGSIRRAALCGANALWPCSNADISTRPARTAWPP